MVTGTKISKRDISIDVARGLGMIFVVYAHALEMSFSADTETSPMAFDQWRFIYSFHMPMFFVISGMVFRQRGAQYAITSSLTLLIISYLSHIAGWVLIFILFNPLALIPGVSIVSMIFISLAITVFLAVISWHILERRALGLKGKFVDYTRKAIFLGGFGRSAKSVEME